MATEKAAEANGVPRRLRGQRIGCDATLTGDDNPDDACRYHPSVPAPPCMGAKERTMMVPAPKLLKRPHHEVEGEEVEEEEEDDDIEEEEEEEDDKFEEEVEENKGFHGDGGSTSEDADDDDEEEEGVGEEEENGGRGGEEEEEDVTNAVPGGGGEMEELEKEYLSIRNEQQTLLKDLKRHKDEDLLKGQAVKNQKTLWNRSLEFRFLLQKAFSSSNRLPQEPVRSSFCSSDESVSQAFSELITSSKQALSCLNELQEALIEKNPSIDPGNSGKSNDVEVEDDEDWLRVSRTQSRFIPFRNSAIDKWQRKTQVTTGAAAFRGKLHAFNQNISDQVGTYMRDPDRMIRKMQLWKATVHIFGEVTENASDRREGEENMDGDPELIDDSEFYQQLLKEFFESCDLASSETAYYAVKKLQAKKRKAVDRRASKSRKIRYNVHEKIVNFMAPKPSTFNDMAAKWFENLFGHKGQKPVGTV